MASTELTIVESYDLARSDESQKLALQLADFIKKNSLSSRIQGKDFVNVEGWQYAGSRLGLVPRVVWTRELATEGNTIRFEARVELYDLRRNEVVGSGEAECDNTESGKKSYARFAIRSMAQTRAVGKAYRNLLAWIIKAAGYNPTPAEEMDSLEPSLSEACLEALQAPDLVALRKVSNKYAKVFGKEAAFILAGTSRHKQLSAAPSASPNGPRLASEEQRAFLSNLLQSHLLEDVREQLEDKLRDPELTMDEISRMLEEAQKQMKEGQRRESFDDSPY